ncbi:MAG: hypothetical protein VX475_15805 [Myxococcota bacterium]|nr:hypothetical protein [Myxococcota bacterium]
MTTTIWICCAVGAIALVAVPMARPNAKKRALARARATGELGGLIAWVEAKPLVAQADAWDQLLLGLWQRYERELAARVIMEAAPRSDAKIVQHWIAQVLSIEPELAQEIFTQEFLAKHFRPDVAAQCGKCGCGG